MANIDVISLIFESFDFIRKHYKEVAFPLAVLLLMSGAGHIGGSSLSNGFSNSLDGSPGAPLLANALSGAESLEAGIMAGTLLALFLFIIAVAVVMAVVSLSVWFYVCEHFYSILNRKKVSTDWQARMKRHILRALVMAIFEFAVFAAFAIAIIACISLVSTSWAAALSLMALVFIICACIGLYFIPVWMYYALDMRPFFESISCSISLVKGNFAHFAIFGAIFMFLNIGAMIGSFYACCFSFLAAPLLLTFVALLSRVTLIKMKLAIEKERKKGILS